MRPVAAALCLFLGACGPPPPAPDAKETPAPAAPEPSAPVPEPPPVFPAGERQSASIVFRTVDGPRATVYLNGEPAVETGGLWSVSESTVFDPAIPVEAWPPPFAQRSARAVKYFDDSRTVVGTIETWVAGGRYPLEPREDSLKRVPHLGAGEQVLYVRAALTGGCIRTGALRVSVVGDDGHVYRHVDFHPPDSEEDPLHHLWTTSVWFER